MIKKLTGGGKVAKRVTNAIAAFDNGLIDVATYISKLEVAFNKLDSFDNQLTQKINNGSIQEPDASQLLAASAEIRSAINNLVANA